MEEFLKRFERHIEELELRFSSGDPDEPRLMPALLSDLMAKKDAIKNKLDELRASSDDRIEVLKMGIESAWVELETAVRTAFSRDLRGETPSSTATSMRDRKVA